MSTEPLYLLDQLETADMLEIDGLHAWQFTLNDALLDRADVAAQAGEPFASDETVVQIECIDGRDRKAWSFSYNAVMEAEYDAQAQCWRLGEHRLACLGAIGVSADDA